MAASSLRVALGRPACGQRLDASADLRPTPGGKRAAEIERETPDLIDQLVVSLEAGIGFSAALQKGVDRLGGALGQEMRLALQEQRIGASLTESLQQLRERVDSPNLQTFVRAVVQGERLGVSIGNIMRDLAIDMRKRRRQMAEEQAQKTPVKLLLPLDLPDPSDDLHRRPGAADARPRQQPLRAGTVQQHERGSTAGMPVRGASRSATSDTKRHPPSGREMELGRAA